MPVPRFPTGSTRLAAAAAVALSLSITACAGPDAGHASHGGHGGHGAQDTPASGRSDYAGLQTRPIKALSERQIADLRAGRGMGYAMPAELNGYPGPLHVLELADRLRLSPAQRERTEALFALMQREARAAGEAMIDAEAALDALFRERRATRDALAQATVHAAAAQGRVRETHLGYHLAMVELLTPEQVALYGRLRGY